jgi:hypothetical protein
MDNRDLALEQRDKIDMEQVLGSSVTYSVARGPHQYCFEGQITVESGQGLTLHQYCITIASTATR